MARGLLDLLLPPMAHDSREATASAGLSPDAWGRVVFLEAPVCDGCGAAFEYDGGDFASDRIGRLCARTNLAGVYAADFVDGLPGASSRSTHSILRSSRRSRIRRELSFPKETFPRSRM